jgi:hypothetical protein
VGEGAVVRSSGASAEVEFPVDMPRYRVSEACSWLFLCANASERVTVTFTAFETEKKFDVARLYDGADASAPALPGAEALSGQAEAGALDEAMQFQVRAALGGGAPRHGGGLGKAPHRIPDTVRAVYAASYGCGAPPLPG